MIKQGKVNDIVFVGLPLLKLYVSNFSIYNAYIDKNKVLYLYLKNDTNKHLLISNDKFIDSYINYKYFVYTFDLSSFDLDDISKYYDLIKKYSELNYSKDFYFFEDKIISEEEYTDLIKQGKPALKQTMYNSLMYKIKNKLFDVIYDDKIPSGSTLKGDFQIL